MTTSRSNPETRRAADWHITGLGKIHLALPFVATPVAGIWLYAFESRRADCYKVMAFLGAGVQAGWSPLKVPGWVMQPPLPAPRPKWRHGVRCSRAFSLRDLHGAGGSLSDASASVLTGVTTIDAERDGLRYFTAEFPGRALGISAETVSGVWAHTNLGC